VSQTVDQDQVFGETPSPGPARRDQPLPQGGEGFNLRSTVLLPSPPWGRGAGGEGVDIIGRVGSERGVSLILVMLALLVLSTLAATIVFTARSETLASYNYKLDTQADYLAKAGLQKAVAWIRSSRYTPVPASSSNTFYALTSSKGSLNLYTSNNSPVQCISGCTVANSGVQLIGYGSGSTNYPSSVGSTSTNFTGDLVNQRITGDPNNSGTFSVNAYLLSYQTVFPTPVATPVPLETWLITSMGSWTGSSAPTATGPIAKAEEQATIQAIYTPNWGYSIYGYCSASMSGSAGVCTDSFNSALGTYGAGNPSVATGACDSTSTNVIAAGADVGANGGVTLGSNVTVAGDVILGNNPPSGCTASGFSGSTNSVLGEVVSGPNVPTPSTPTFPANLTSAPSPSWSGGVTAVTYPLPSNPPTLAFSTCTGCQLDENLYYYVVTALGSWGESAQTENSIYVDLGGSNNIKANGQVTVSWSAVSGATSYRVYRGTFLQSENTYYTVTAPTTSFTDTGATGTSGSPPNGFAEYPTLPPTNGMAPPGWTTASGQLNPNTTYYYLVTALGSFGETLGSDSPATTGSSNSTQGVTVNWTACQVPTQCPSAPVAYHIYRGSAAGQENVYYSAKGNATSYTDKGNKTPISGSPASYPNPWLSFSSGTGANPPFFAGSTPTCPSGNSCDGTAANPFQINSVSMSSSNVLQLIGGKDILHPVYYNIYDFQESGGSLLVSGYAVLNIQNSLKIAGNGTANPMDYQTNYGVAVNAPPECVQINYAGTQAVQVQGNGAVSATITAPNATVQVGGGGSAGYMVGAVRALNVSMQGGYPLHYDLQLARDGGTVGLTVISAYSRKKM
jgi:Tfp pilus assembly protein PilX